MKFNYDMYEEEIKDNWCECCDSPLMRCDCLGPCSTLDRPRRIIRMLEVCALVLMWLTAIWFCVAAVFCK